MASFTERIAVVVDSRVGGAVRGLGQVGAGLDGVATRSGRAQRGLGALVGGMASATSFSGAMGGALGRAGAAMGGLATQTSRAAGALPGYGTAAVIGIGIVTTLAAVAVSSANAFSQATAEARTLQRTMGGTAEEASRLRYVGKVLGVDMDSLGRAGTMLARNIGGTTSRLHEYGIEVERDSQGNALLGQTIANIADAYQATDDPARKAKIRQEAFRRSGEAMIPILSKTREEIQALFAEGGESNQIFSDADFESGRQMLIATRELELELQGLELEIGRQVVPALTGMARGINIVIDGAETLAGAPLSTLTAILQAATGQFGQAGATLAGIFTEGSEKAADGAYHHVAAEEARAQAARDAEAALAAELGSLSGLVGSTLAYEGQLIRLATATSNYTEAQAAATAAGGGNVEANQKAYEALVAMRNQIDAVALAAQRKAEQEAGPGATAATIAMLGHQAYVASLEQSAQSASPAAREQAQQLLAILREGFDGKTYTASVGIDTTKARNDLAAFLAEADKMVDESARRTATRMREARHAGVEGRI